MTPESRKKWVLFVGSLFIAVIFLTSYAAFSNNSGFTSSTTTVKSVRTFFVSGNTLAPITGYGNVAFVTLINKSNATNTKIVNKLNALQANGSVSNFVIQNNSYQVLLSTINPYALQNILYNVTSQNSINVTANGYVSLPSNITMYYNTVALPVHPPTRNVSVSITGIRSIGTRVNLSISGLVTANGTIYNNQFRVTIK